MRKINTFWNWFQDNNQTIKNLINDTLENQKKIIFWANKHLGYYCEEMDFIIVFPKTPKDKSQFIITASDNRECLKQLIDLLDGSPKLKTWKFSAIPLLSQTETSESMPITTIFPDVTLKSADLKFLSLDYNKNTKKESIIIDLKNQKILCNTKTINQVLTAISLNELSEIPVDKNLTFVQLPQATQDNTECIQLYDLEIYINLLYRQNIP